MQQAPVISGARVHLRAHVIADMAALAAFYASARARMMDVPDSETQLWYGFASEVGSWPLTGMGAWAIEVNGQTAGQVAITQPPHFAEPELGWLLFDGFEGQGFAFEAARLALDFARNTLKPASLVSYIDAANTRSIALAKRLGARHDPDAAAHDPEDVVYRHALAA